MVPSRKGIPIGNLTSQIFANIYLNEFDQFIVHTLKPLHYLRYGDDFLLFAESEHKAHQYRAEAQSFLTERLRLSLHQKNDIIVKARHGIHFLGMHIYPKGRRLNRRNKERIKNRLGLQNVASYGGIMEKHAKEKERKAFNWRILDLIHYEL